MAGPRGDLCRSFTRRGSGPRCPFQRRSNSPYCGVHEDSHWDAPAIPAALTTDEISLELPALSTSFVVLADVIDPVALAAEVAAGNVLAKRHSTLPLTLYTYSRGCQYDGHWNDVTRLCRGLVVEDGGRIVARPLPKFFNYEEHGRTPWAGELPLEPFRVYEKVDGSLAILFSYAGRWEVATKGSFESDQARWARRRLDENPDALAALDPSLTYCAEIIEPGNRIVVDYGAREDLVLIAGISADGTEVPLEELAEDWRLGSVVSTHGGEWTPEEIASLLAETGGEVRGDAAEGYVLRFASGLRCKAKYQDYKTLHYLLSNVTERDIWRAVVFDEMEELRDAPVTLAQLLHCPSEDVLAMLEAGVSRLAVVTERLPDEFDAWAHAVVDRLHAQVAEVEERALALHESIRAAVGEEDRRAYVEELRRRCDDPLLASCCSALAKGKPFRREIWRSLYPDAAPLFRIDEES